MILVLNCGSQSIKWKLFDLNLKVLKEREVSVFNQKLFGKKLKEELSFLKNQNIDYIGHRVVHGGEKFKETVFIGKKDIKKLEKLNDFAPLHNPFNVLGIKSAISFFKKSKQVAVFDTEFYKNLPQKSYIYPLPGNIRKKGFKRFGFHGISHEYAAQVASEEEGINFKKAKIISCHLGGGSSITAINRGKAIDTSMGFTPLEGLMMMTRTGDIDPGIVLEICKDYGYQKAKKVLYSESGIKGISGISNMIDLFKEIKKGNKKAKLAFDIFIYRIKKYIGSYYAILGGCDLIVFTGTIGSGKAKTRNAVLSNLPFLTKTRVIKPDEERAIAKKVIKLIK
jgi:acetate kinase